MRHGLRQGARLDAKTFYEANIAMSIGLVPITGLPLPFISSGRTFLVTMMCGLGLIQSVTIHREEQLA